VLNGSPLIWRNRKIILLARDPKDVLVSGYFHARYRSKSFSGSISEYIRHPYTGIEKLLIAHQRWFDYSRTSRAFMLQRYEWFHDDLEGSVRNMIDFLGIDFEPAALRAAMEFARFENMAKLELEGYFESRAMRLHNPLASARKVREGKVGGCAEHMSAEDIAHVDSMIARMGDPFQKDELVEASYS